MVPMPQRGLAILLATLALTQRGLPSGHDGVPSVAKLRSFALLPTQGSQPPTENELEIRDVKATSGVTYKLGQPMSTIEVTVTDRAGRPIAGATVRVELPPPSGPGATFSRSGCSQSCDYLTDRSGVARITGLRANYNKGDWSPAIYAEHSGRTSQPYLPAITNAPLDTTKDKLGDLLKKALPVAGLLAGLAIGLSLGDRPPSSRTLRITPEEATVDAATFR